MGYDQIYHLAISVALGREVQRAEGLHWLIQLGYWTGLWDSRSCLGALKPWLVFTRPVWALRRTEGPNSNSRTRTTKCRMGGQPTAKGASLVRGPVRVVTGAPRRIFGWGTLPLRCLIGVGVAACSVCLSVGFRSRVVVGVWLACHPASGLRSANH